MNSHHVKDEHKSKSVGVNHKNGIVIEHLDHHFTKTSRKPSKIKQGMSLFIRH